MATFEIKKKIDKKTGEEVISERKSVDRPTQQKETTQEMKLLEEKVNQLVKSDRYTFQKLIQLLDGRNIQAGRTNGTKIGTATDQKIAFHNATPVIQAAHIADPSGGLTIDAEARSAIDAILVVLENKGFTAKS